MPGSARRDKLFQERGSQFLGPVFMYGAIFAIFYFVLIRPQSKQRKEHEALIRAVKKGDEVVTAGGLIGEVIHIKETPKDGKSGQVMDDEITIKSGESRLIVERGRIGKILSQTTSVTTT